MHKKRGGAFMKDALGIIYTVEEDADLKELTRKRSIAAVPFGGRYRMIDFVLSNMVNSGLRNVGIITQNNYSSLIDHIGSGKEWDLNRRSEGLYVLSPYANHNNPGWYKGSIDALHSVMGFIRRSRNKYVILTGTHMVCNMGYDDVMKYHIEKNADITLVYKEINDISKDKLRKYTLIQTDEDGRVCDMEINPTAPGSNKICMKMYIIEKNLLEYLVEEGVARGNNDFVRDILLKKLDRLKIYGYRYDGYLARIDSISAYYRYNMELLNPEIRSELFFKTGLIYTKIKSEVPAKYGDSAQVKNCLVADGCVIEGEVENCILFRGVKVYKGAKVKNSIIMQDVEIEENSVLDHVILDKNVILKRGKTLIGQEHYPVVIGKGEWV
jgi:glucose-1-phosphate adenylyltransferase